MVAADPLNEDILSLGMRADEARRRGTAPARVLYQRVHVVTPAAVRDELTIPEPASEVRITDLPETLEQALTVARAAKEAAGPRPLTAFSAADLIRRAHAGWGDVGAVLAQLSSAGISDFAEFPLDAIDDIENVMGLARAAGFGVSRLTIANAVAQRKADMLERIRRAAQAGGVARVNPLPRCAPADKPTTGYEDVRMVALTRLALADLGAAASIFVEVDWALYGPKLAQVALTFGADFLDAVPATNDDSLGRRRGTVEDVERNIRAAGFEPEEYRPRAGEVRALPEQGRGRE
jgi:aminodeoxyfutalosine synthase